ncbi:hypothetical protein [Paractinoplanes rishiriensis]|uniref:hypothetical protein n=1 Tax=Paractinoplanes rishiriensis TaxID=1050105 RepID=UPI0019435A81|nr:hypothetical protein [Actinoplanes rishiriensis]
MEINQNLKAPFPADPVCHATMRESTGAGTILIRRHRVARTALRRIRTMSTTTSG